MSISNLPHPEVDRAMLDLAVWHNPKLQHLEQALIRLRENGQIVKAQYHEEEHQFYYSDYEIKPWECQWRKIFPECPRERAAINYLAILENGQ